MYYDLAMVGLSHIMLYFETCKLPSTCSLVCIIHYYCTRAARSTHNYCSACARAVTDRTDSAQDARRSKEDNSLNWFAQVSFPGD